jgi:uncharacterized membrane protein YeiH
VRLADCTCSQQQRVQRRADHLAADHYGNFTVIRVLLIALLGGLARDVLLNKIQSALTSPAYIPCA